MRGFYLRKDAETRKGPGLKLFESDIKKGRFIVAAEYI